MSKSSGNFFAYKCNVGVTDSDVEDIYSAMSNMPLQRMIEFARQLTAYQTGDKGNVVRGVLNYEQAAKLVNSDPFIRDTMAALAEAKDKSGGWTYDLNKRDQTTPVYQIWNGVLKCSHR
jgi:hypothetical protein